MNESCPIWMSRAIQEWVTSHRHESCHIWISRVKWEWVMSNLDQSCHIWRSHVTCERVTSHMNRRCCLVVPHCFWYIHIETHSYGAAFFVIYTCRNSCIWCRIVCDIYLSTLIHMVPHSYVTWGNMSDSYVTWLIHTWHDSFIRDMTPSYATWLIHTWHDSFIRDMTHSHVTWLIHTWHDSFICDMTIPMDTWPVVCIYPFYRALLRMYRDLLRRYRDVCLWAPTLINQCNYTRSCHIWISHVTYELDVLLHSVASSLSPYTYSVAKTHRMP